MAMHGLHFHLHRQSAIDMEAKKAQYSKLQSGLTLPKIPQKSVNVGEARRQVIHQIRQ